jgi:hypothetical protein
MPRTPRVRRYLRLLGALERVCVEPGASDRFERLDGLVDRAWDHLRNEEKEFLLLQSAMREAVLRGAWGKPIAGEPIVISELESV